MEHHTQAVSNARPVAVFAGYMVAAAVLTAASITTVCAGASTRRHRGHGRSASHAHRPRAAIVAFAALAVLSLATTWRHMFGFFRWSYLEWAASRGQLAAEQTPLSELRLGEWLRDTTLFKQAWAATLETPARAWWSLQVFGCCANWSVTLAVQAKRRAIPRVCVFMLLGQVVAISFAMNLSFLAFLLHDAVLPTSLERDPVAGPAASSPSLNHFILALNISLALVIPGSFGHPHFMWLLLAPHLLAFAPLLLNALSSRGKQPAEPSWYIKSASQAVIVAVATTAVARQGGSLAVIAGAFYEHPAVSSVGWDVICCWLSSVAWYALGEA
ncbi:Uncharacterized protein TPAR_02725 [Tolypocladium paradoxum]|uniref:Alpha-mannosyltransferase alg11p n=1 Tax=Tolypocladium paradoxum TaxID=94208 RepID=A0A2S4L3T8_9HYPO|nr:Uncharacterized protein TPAR_02725 [Tolypocladium paradoxum]